MVYTYVEVQVINSAVTPKEPSFSGLPEEETREDLKTAQEKMANYVGSGRPRGESIIHNANASGACPER